MHPAELVVGHTAAAVLRDANKTSATLADFRELVRAFWAARTNQNLDPRLRLELVRVVGATSDHLFILWIRCVDQAKREAEIALETSPG